MSLLVVVNLLRSLAQLVKMFGGNVHGAVEPCDRPTVKGKAGEHVLVAQRGKKLVLIDERLAVEDDTAAVVEVQLQQIVAHDAGSSDPFQSVILFHIVLVKWVNLSQRLAVLHALPVLQSLVFVVFWGQRYSFSFIYRPKFPIKDAKIGRKCELFWMLWQ